MDDFVLTLSDVVLVLIANTVITGIFGNLVDMIWHRAFSEPEDSFGRVAEASERVADAAEGVAETLDQARLSGLFGGKDA